MQLTPSTKSMIVVDQTHISAGATLQEMCVYLEEALTTYLKILNQVTTEAAKKGITTDRYKEYAGVISGLRGQLERMGNFLNLTATEFVNNINTADDYLY